MHPSGDVRIKVHPSRVLWAVACANLAGPAGGDAFDCLPAIYRLPSLPAGSLSLTQARLSMIPWVRLCIAVRRPPRRRGRGVGSKPVGSGLQGSPRTGLFTVHPAGRHGRTMGMPSPGQPSLQPLWMLVLQIRG